VSDSDRDRNVKVVQVFRQKKFFIRASFDQMPVAHIYYTVLVETLNHAQSINSTKRIYSM